MRLRIRVRLPIVLAVAGLAFQIAFSTAFGAAPQGGSLTAVYHTHTGGKTQIILKGTAPVQYNLERAEKNAIWVEIPGMAGDSLLPLYKIGTDAVSTLEVQRSRSGAPVSTKIKINLTQACDITPVGRDNLLILTLSPKASAQDRNSESNGSGKPATAVKDIRFAADRSGVHATIQTDGKPDYEAFVTPESTRIVVDVKGTRDAVVKKLFPVGASNLENIKVGQYKSTDPKVTRVVFELTKATPYTITADGNDIRVDIAGEVASAKPDAKAEIELASAEYAKTLPAPVATPPAAQPAPSSNAGSDQKETRGEPVLHREGQPAQPVPPVTAPRESTQKNSTQESSLTSGKTRRGVASESEAGTQGAALTVHISGDTASPAKPVVSDIGTPPSDQTPKDGYGSPEFEGEPISLDLKQIDIRDVARYISSTYGVNFVFDKSVAQVPVTISISEVPWNQALDAILAANDLATTHQGSLIRIVTTARLEQEETQKKKLRDARILAEPLVTKLIRLQYEQVETSGGGGNARASSGDSSDTAAPASGGSGGGNRNIGIRAIVSSRLSTRGRVEIDPRTNTLVVTDVAEHVKAVEQIVAQLDRPERQVEIECRIVRVNHDFSRDLGVQLSGLTSNPSRGGAAGINTLQPIAGKLPNAQIGPQPLTQLLGGIPGAPSPIGGLGAAAATSVIGLTTGVFGTNAITSLLTAAESRGTANIISSPRVTAQNNRLAEIERGVRIPVQTISNNTISTMFVTAALRLQIQPQITDTGEVVLHLIAENDAPDFSRQVLGIPTIATQRAETIVRLPDGGTTIFGGISIDSDTKTEFRTPGLGRLPLIGELFKRRESGRSTDEILFFLTPRIFKPELVGLQDLLPGGKDDKKDEQKKDK